MSFRFEPGPGDAARVRLDQFLIDEGVELSRSQLERVIKAGDVTVNGAVTKPGFKLKAGDEVAVVLRAPVEARAVAQDIDLDILYQDDDVVVVDKPAGLVVHPAPGHPDGTLVNALLHHCQGLAGIGGELRPGIVHRLDRDTSGVMIAAKGDAAHQRLVEMFAAKDLVREYLAIVAPAPELDSGTFDTLYGRHPTHRKKFSSKVERGKRACTHYRVEERLGRAALVRCRLETGRTHQIRVHFADHGAPVLGDPVYARRPRDPELAAVARDLARQALHAARLALAHPITGAPLAFETDLPADMASALDRLRVLHQGA